MEKESKDKGSVLENHPVVERQSKNNKEGWMDEEKTGSEEGYSGSWGWLGLKQ